MSSDIAKVVVNLSLDWEFDYRIPPALRGRVRVGTRVLVPFGRGREPRPGFVVGLAASSAWPEVKDILGIQGAADLIPPKLIELARWLADYYCCAHEQAVRTLLPAVVRHGRMQKKTVPFVVLEPAADLATVLPRLERRAPKQAEIVKLLVRLGRPEALARVMQEAGAGREAVKRLEVEGVVRLERREVQRDPLADDIILPAVPPAPNPAQVAALDAICPALAAGGFHAFLLHGITGSGKTEVYLRAISRCLELGRSAVVLVPEIALTPQTMERFRQRFGDQVSVLHSGLSDGERFDEWTRIHEGRARIAVGPRSALFAPFRDLGLIVVDEEHENTYKQEEAPRYNARDVAVVRASLEGAVVLLGSATPSLESWRNCRIGKYRLLRLPERVDSQRLPRMELVDMRTEAALQGGAQIFSRRLQDLIRGRLEAGEQTILFLNRRGYATQMLCSACGYTAMCPDCSAAYTYHRQQARLVCHLCGEVRPAPLVCPQCNDKNIRFPGLGTEKVESVARKLFPKAVIARMDSDTMTEHDAYRKTLLAFRSGRIHILIGTQMIAKGLHFPNVSLVGIIFADLSLHIPDFRAGERTFQLLTQVAGRAGRGDIPGQVVVQSYTPYNPALQYAMEARLDDFVNEELEARETLGFPPAAHMALITFRAGDEGRAAGAAEAFAAELRPLLPAGAKLSGPTPAPIAKIRKLHRFQVNIRGGNIRQLTGLLRARLKTAPAGVDIAVDIDPQSLM